MCRRTFLVRRRTKCSSVLFVDVRRRTSTNIDEHRRTGPCHKGNPRRTTTNNDEHRRTKIFFPPTTNIDEHFVRLHTMPRGGGVGGVTSHVKSEDTDQKKFFLRKKMDITLKNQKIWSPGDLQFNSAWFWTLLSTCGGLIRIFQKKKKRPGTGFVLWHLSNRGTIKTH